MSAPNFRRLGGASVLISISDADGFRVVHGTDEVTLQHVPPEHCPDDAWKRLWDAVAAIVLEGQENALQKDK